VVIFCCLVTCTLAASAACNSLTNCATCAAQPSGLSNCRWCFRDQKCHAYGAIFTNPCSAAENIANKALCGCSPSTCVPSGGVPVSNCDWYSSGSVTPAPDPRNWGGGDFLPYGYAKNAACACSGNGNPLWDSAAAKCVREQVLRGHQALSADVKKDMRAITLSGDLTRFTLYVGPIMQLHAAAYRYCCCPGTVANYIEWWLTTKVPLPCATVIPAVLEQSRCGCGF